MKTEKTKDELLTISLPNGLVDRIAKERAVHAQQVSRLSQELEARLRLLIEGYLAGIEGADGKMFDLAADGSALYEKQIEQNE